MELAASGIDLRAATLQGEAHVARALGVQPRAQGAPDARPRRLALEAYRQVHRIAARDLEALDAGRLLDHRLQRERRELDQAVPATHAKQLAGASLDADRRHRVAALAGPRPHRHAVVEHLAD